MSMCYMLCIHHGLHTAAEAKIEKHNIVDKIMIGKKNLSNKTKCSIQRVVTRHSPRLI